MGRIYQKTTRTITKKKVGKSNGKKRVRKYKRAK
jgi:hypothetical protein